MKPLYVKLIAGSGILLVGFIVLFMMFDVVPIKGNQIGVREDWWNGVNNDPLPPKTYFVWPWQRVQAYSASVQVFVMNDKTPEHGEINTGRKQDSYLVQSKDSQDMHLSLQVQWRIDPTHVIEIHKTVGPDLIEEKLLRPTLLRVVKDEATTREAIQAYSGTGLVSLQQAIEKDLNSPEGELRKRGVIVDSFVIEHIKLDEEYVKEIKARQVAIQKEMRSVQEEKAAQAEALNAKAMAQADLNKKVVEAERDKQVLVLAAEAENEKAILEAEAAAKKVVLAAQAKKDSGELEAASILAIGTANAESEKLKFTAYSAPGAELYTKIQVAKSMEGAFGNIKGYIPENMTIFTLGDSFMKSVENITAAKK